MGEGGSDLRIVPRLFSISCKYFEYTSSHRRLYFDWNSNFSIAEKWTEESRGQSRRRAPLSKAQLPSKEQWCCVCFMVIVSLVEVDRVNRSTRSLFVVLLATLVSLRNLYSRFAEGCDRRLASISWLERAADHWLIRRQRIPWIYIPEEEEEDP